MKLTIRVLALVTVLACLLSGCGLSLPFVPAEPSPSQEPVQETPVAFGTTEIGNTPVLQAETTEAPTPTPSPEIEEETEPPEPEPQETAAPELDPDVEMTDLVVRSALCADYVEDLWYDPEGMYFWRAVGYLMGLAGPYLDGAETGSDEDGDYVRLPADSLDLFVAALFGDYFEENETEYPSLGEEHPLVAWESTEDGEFYLVRLPDISSYTAEYEETDWSHHYIATLLVDGSARALYEITIEDAEDDPVFPMHIVEMAYAGKP